MTNVLAETYPQVGTRLRTLPLATLPTPVSHGDIVAGDNTVELFVKHDDLTGTHYGGNKLRKLEYLLQRAQDKDAERVATFGTVGSHHAIATAMYARKCDLDCTCFLSHQSLHPGIGDALRFHLQNGTEVIRWGGKRAQRIQTLREHLHNRNTWVIPIGGSSWLGSVGYVNAGLELAAQIKAGELEQPERIYIALGTMGSAAGLALGLALAGINSEIHAVRVTIDLFCNEPAMRRLMKKLATMLNRIEPAIPADLDERSNVIVRHEFLGDGYGKTTDATDAAIELAREQRGLLLESTYTGKAMAALLDDIVKGVNGPLLFWNTYNSRPLDVDKHIAPDDENMPAEFARYFDS